ncbi:MAG TPA: lipocalin family protein [Gemmataceae bacterium]|nr:lipocalin family protein [Gemmataceae bacterium]
MKSFGCLAVAVILAGLLSGLARADDKVDKTKLTAVWKLVKSDEPAPKDATAEFTKDGKLIVQFEMDGQQQKLEGSYTLDGNKITAVLKKGENEEKDILTITTLTDNKLVIENKDGKKHEFEKVKK